MDLLTDNRLALTRREFLGQGASGIGAAALASLLGPGLGQAATGGLAGFPQFAAKAKRVIYLTQSGAPSHTDLFETFCGPRTSTNNNGLLIKAP